MRWAVYDLRSSPPSFDFLAFVILAKYHGAEGMYFIPGVCERKLGFYTPEEQSERVRTILEPMCELYGLPFKYGEESRRMDVAWPPLYRSGKPMMGYTFAWMKSITAPEPIMPSEDALHWARQELGSKDRIVVHTRSGKNIPKRNSGPDWERWADDHDAYICADHSEGPISLDKRVALHELAGLNIGAAAGHMQISVFSKHRPYISMKFLSNAGVSTTQEWHESQGYLLGDQMPWAGPHQRLVWDPKDDYESIENQYQQWRATVQ